MHLGIKAKQVVGVTSVVGAVVVILSVLHVARLAQIGLEESRTRAELLANAVFHRAREVVAGSAGDPAQALAHDRGLHSVLESALYSKNVTFAAIADRSGLVVAHADPAFEGQRLADSEDLPALMARPALGQLKAIYAGQGRNLEFRQKLLLGDTEFGSIRIGVSTLLIRQDLNSWLRPALVTAAIALGLSVLVATLLAQLLLRPIHVLKGGLTRLGRGELGVRLDLGRDDEFGELGAFFNDVSAQLSADRTEMAGQVANLETAVEFLEDAVAIVNPAGELLFVNPSMQAWLPGAAPGVSLETIVGSAHALPRAIAQTTMTRESRGPVPVVVREQAPEPASEFAGRGERLVTTHALCGPDGHLVAVMVVARDLEYLNQVQSTISYSRKLAALGRLSAGVAHEVKNPLNAMMIHLELLRQQVTSVASAVPLAGLPIEDVPSNAALQHVDVIANEIRRLDEVVQGFIKFSRPEDLRLQPVRVAALVDEIVAAVRPDAERQGVELRVECDHVPDVNADPAMLRQALLNLALNACQSMPSGGVLRIRAEPARGGRIAILFVDTGVGIAPEDLSKIFDLYFTTKTRGSGIGLSMVYRTVQMHNGDIEVESTPGVGTTFRLLLPGA